MIPSSRAEKAVFFRHFTISRFSAIDRWHTSTVQLTTTKKMDLQRPLTLPGYSWGRKTHPGDNGVEWTELNRICLHMFEWFFISTHRDPPPPGNSPLKTLSLLLKILSPPPKISGGRKIDVSSHRTVFLLCGAKLRQPMCWSFLPQMWKYERRSRSRDGSLYPYLTVSSCTCGQSSSSNVCSSCCTVGGCRPSSRNAFFSFSYHSNCAIRAPRILFP